MNIFAFLIASFVNFTSLIHTLCVFYTIDGLRKHPWIKPKLSYIEGKYSIAQHKIARTPIKNAQLYLAKKAAIIASIFTALFIISVKLEFKLLLVISTYVSSFSFYYAMSVYLGYRPMWVLKFISSPYLKISGLCLLAGSFEFLLGTNNVSNAVDEIITHINYSPLTSFMSPNWMKTIFFALTPIFLIMISFCAVYIFSLPGFALSFISVGGIICFARFIDDAGADQRLSMTCSIYIIISELLKKYFNIDN